MKRINLSLLLFITTTATWSQSSDRVEFEAPLVYPEGIAFDSKNNITFVSSVKTGTVGKVDAQGKYTEFFVDRGFKSSFGMKVDQKKGKLWVCIGDPMYSIYKDSTTFKKMARLIGIDIATGKKTNDIDLAPLFKGKHFPNDLTLDDKGNIYVTDSFSPVIYKIDEKGNASLFSQSDIFRSVAIGLNGVVFHPEGFLLVAHNSSGYVLKVSVKNPTDVQRVEIDQFFPGADGLWLDEQNNLVLVQGKGVNRIFKLSSTDKWKTAKVIAVTPPSELFQNPTTIGARGKDLFILNAKLNEITDKSLKPSDKFSFQKINFVQPSN